MVLNIHVRNTENIGDLVCHPSRYFPELGATPKDIRSLDRQDREGKFIVGGGGLYHETLFMHLRFLAMGKSDHKIAWGVGHNMNEQKISWPSWMMRFTLAGVRDFTGHRLKWVPCASCMDSLFDDIPEPIRDAVCYEHYQLGSLNINDFPQMTNRRPRDVSVGKYFKQVIDFLASARTVITTTYHGAYWATLLGRRVVAVPSSTRFHGFRHPPALSTRRGWRIGVKQATTYPEALEECRAANVEFLGQVKAVLG